MVRLPVWELALIILIPMAAAYGVRGMLERKLVDAAAPIRRSALQFRLELGLFFSAAIVMAFILLGLYHFPLLQSGMKLVLGIFTVGVFAALDLALARERMVIDDALTGRASYTPPTRLSPLTRKFSLVATLVLLLITAIIILVIIRDVRWLAEQDLSLDTIGFLGRSVLVEILFVMGFLLIMVINLVFSYARNLRLLFDNQTVVLENVSRGDLTRKVPVTTNDELGVIAGHTNTMITALRDRVRMREGLLIAQEVQQHFLPESPPQVHGVDVAGSAHFSDETGGDFYDFVECTAPGCDLVAVVVGDVSGHGIGAALLMAAGRALLRHSAVSTVSPSQAVAEVNRQFVRDLSDTGRFMTLFFMMIDPVKHKAAWVNAGHQPPIVYDSNTDTFSDLRGQDIPLGVEGDWFFHETFMDLPGPGQVLLIGTDGLWEARNPDGEMFGTSRVQQTLRAHAHKSAAAILEAISETIQDFTTIKTQEDDVTLVVLKGVEE